MGMSDFNDIGVSRRLDWPRIRKLLRIGLFASLLLTAGNLWLGWGLEDETLNGLKRTLSAYVGKSDSSLLLAALIGMFAMTLMGLSCFGVYRLLAEQAMEYAHRYRSGISGFCHFFGGCGFHVPMCAWVYLVKHFGWTDMIWKYGLCFLLPGTVLFFASLLYLQIVQIRAFAREVTPYPGWSWIFTALLGMAMARCAGIFGNAEWINAVKCAWIGIGGIWMFGGLLIAGKITIKGEIGNERN